MAETPSRKIWKGFKEHFGVNNIFIHKALSQIRGKYEFDIFEFESWLATQGFKERPNTSMADFIEEKYGREAMLFIVSLL